MAVAMGVDANAARCVLEQGPGCRLRDYLSTTACESVR
jgi:hypothetical protein